jgi:hypothetical protein
MLPYNEHILKSVLSLRWLKNVLTKLGTGRIIDSKMTDGDKIPLLTTANYNVFYCILCGPGIVHVLVDLSVCDVLGV